MNKLNMNNTTNCCYNLGTGLGIESSISLSASNITTGNIIIDNEGNGAYIDFNLQDGEDGGLRFNDNGSTNGFHTIYDSSTDKLVFNSIDSGVSNTILSISGDGTACNILVEGGDPDNNIDSVMTLRARGTGAGSSSLFNIYGQRNNDTSTELAQLNFGNYDNSPDAGDNEINDLARLSIIRDSADNTDANLLFSTKDGGSMTEKMRITPGGDVGIGTNSPVQELHIHSAGTNATRLQLTNDSTGTTTNDGFIIGLRNTDETVLINRENTPMSFFTNSDEKMTILGSGNVGIGTNVPDNLLHVEQTTGGNIAKFETTNTTDGGIEVKTGTNGSSYVLFNDGTLDGSINFSGNIMTFEIPDNTEVFRVDANSIDLASGTSLQHRNGTINNINSGGSLTVQGPGTYQTIFQTSSLTGANSEVVIRGARNLSTTEDTALLRFQNYDDDISSSDTLATISARVVDTTNNNDGQLVFQTRNNGNPVEAMFIDNNGYVGINTSSMTRYFTLQHDTDTVGIEFRGSTGTGVNPVISTSALGTYYGKIKVLINGTRRWISLYND